jgi:hypothetical protein
MQRTALGVCLVALATLMLELVLTRVFDVVLMPNLSYMVITCAVFAFGLAGLYATIWPLADSGPAGSAVSVLCAGFATTVLGLLPALNSIPFDWDAIGAAPVRQLAAFAVMYAVLVLPFFASGLILTTLFSRHARHIRRLYAWDLVGAGIGCVALIPFLPKIGPGGILFLVAALGLFASALFTERPRWRWATGTTAVLVAAVPFLVPSSTLEFHEHINKRGVKVAQREGKVEFSRWDPISKIDVIPIQGAVGKLGDSLVMTNAAWHVAYDGGQQSTNFFRFDGDLGRLRAELDSNAPFVVRKNFWLRGVLASHFLKRDQDHHVLIFGSAGGQEAKAALLYGATKVDAVEMVRTVVDLATGPYSAAIGNIFHHPAVDVHVDEGRSFLRASGERYDIIQIFSNFTSSSIATGSGALFPAYLQTAEAYREYFEHLTRDGIIHVNHLAYPRMITTAALAWRQMGRTDFRRHVVVVDQIDRPAGLPTMLIKASPWTAQEIADLGRFFEVTDARDEGVWRIVESPLDPAVTQLSDDFYSGEFPRDVEARMAWRASPITDDQPFFFMLRKRMGQVAPDAPGYMSASVASILNDGLKLHWLPLDWLHLIVVGIAAMVSILIAIVVPLARAPIGRARWPRRASSMAYFACLGAGFMMLELVVIQIFMKLIGSPLYTYSTVIFTLLLGAGLGSRVSESLDIASGRRWMWPFVGVQLAGGLILWFHDPIFAAALSAPLPIRILTAGALIIPLGLCLGMPFPLGILAIERQPTGAIAWAWALNGIFTIVGGLLAVLLSMTLGFRWTLLIALAVYVVAFGLFSRMRAPGEALDRGEGETLEVATAA